MNRNNNLLTYIPYLYKYEVGAVEAVVRCIVGNYLVNNVASPVAFKVGPIRPRIFRCPWSPGRQTLNNNNNGVLVTRPGWTCCPSYADYPKASSSTWTKEFGLARRSNLWLISSPGQT